MNVTLNIENDNELRTYIKDCIKGQVLSVVREEFVEMVHDELERKVKGIDERRYDQIHKAAAAEAMKDILYKEYGITTYNTDFIKPFVEQAVKRAVDSVTIDWDKTINQLAKEKIRSMVA